jgi:hypothetical protein
VACTGNVNERQGAIKAARADFSASDRPAFLELVTDAQPFGRTGVSDSRRAGAAGP